MQRVRRASTESLQQAALLPDGVRLDFDPLQEVCEIFEDGGEPTATAGHVQKTSQRTVVSLEHGRFQAREVVRQPTGNGPSGIWRSAQLAGVVPSGGRYGFDLIAHVGVETYLRGRGLEDVRQELADRWPAIDIPTSSLWDQQQKFLFYLGRVHEQAGPRIREYLAAHRPLTWLLDGTTEPDAPVFLGVEDAGSRIVLGGWKVPSENLQDIARCLEQIEGRYGRPDRILHDLSGTMSGACDQALPGVPHLVCQFHFGQDVGKDVYEKPQAALGKRLRSLKLRFRLREQRRGQTEWLRDSVDSSASLVLEELLAGRPVQVPFSQTLGREVLLAFHFWILDYRSDGRRRGFPFDPYLLYLHRRLVRAGQAVDRLLSHAEVARQAPQVLFNFQRQLEAYRHDAEIVAATDLYERAFAMFARLRDALRLSAQHLHNLRELHELPVSEQKEMKMALEELRHELRQQVEDENDIDRPLAHIVLVHLDKYWAHLVPDQPPAPGERWERTTNKLESDWGGLKRGRRRTHGRGKLTRDFQALPEEYLLIRKLENEAYVALVFGGSLESLPSKLAAASREAGSFDAWRRRRRPRLLGKLPRHLLREDDFVDHLIQACDDHCQSSRKNAA